VNTLSQKDYRRFCRRYGKNFLSVIVGVCVVGLALIPLLVPTEHLTYTQWRVAIIALGAVAIVALILQAVLQSQLDTRLEQKFDVIVARLPMPAVPALEQQTPKTTAVAVKLIRSILLPESWAQILVDDFYRVQGKPAPKADYDYLCELLVVNESDHPLTVERFRGMVRFGEQEWEKMRQIRDLSNYDLKTGTDTFARKPLVSLSEKISGVPLNKAIGYRGWLRFQFEATCEQLRNPVLVEILAVDALGNEHEVVIAKDSEEFEDEPTYSARNLRGD